MANRVKQMLVGHKSVHPKADI